MPLYIATKIIMPPGCDLVYVYSNLGVMLKRVNFHGHLKGQKRNWKWKLEMECETGNGRQKEHDHLAI